MPDEFIVLLGTASTLGFVHTLMGPDHYLPFVAMARIGRWSPYRMGIITILCGLGHVLSSTALGFAGVAFGLAVTRVEVINDVRGEIAAWLLIAFGMSYFIWGLQRAIRNKPHKHAHLHVDEGPHSHSHGHEGEHSHVHQSGSAEKMTPWILFTIFVFGPCEVLIPLIMYTAARDTTAHALLVSAVFGVSTLATMLGAVLISHYGLAKFSLGRFERYSHAVGGLVIFLCGGAIKWLGL